MQTTSSPTATCADLSDDLPVRLPDAGPTCLCGAELTRRQNQCRKCRARERWHRHNRLHDDNRRRTDAYRTTQHFTRLWPTCAPGRPADAALFLAAMSPVRALALGVLWATSSPARLLVGLAAVAVVAVLLIAL